MPVRSLNSSVMKWPRRETVEGTLRQWVEVATAQNPAIAAVGYFGSYSRNQAGVGSDLDVIVLLQSGRDEPEQHPFSKRRLAFDFGLIPVPVDVIVYTLEEWENLEMTSPKFYKTLIQESTWVWQKVAFKNAFEQS